VRTPYEVKVVILLTPSSPKKYLHESKTAQVRDVRILRQVGRFQISDDYALPNAADLMNEIDLR
jgi:hypothetical protein